MLGCPPKAMEGETDKFPIFDGLLLANKLFEELDLSLRIKTDKEKPTTVLPHVQDHVLIHAHSFN